MRTPTVPAMRRAHSVYVIGQPDGRAPGAAAAALILLHPLAG